jgi:hypothetical protein
MSSGNSATAKKGIRLLKCVVLMPPKTLKPQPATGKYQFINPLSTIIKKGDGEKKEKREKRLFIAP